MSDSDDDYGDRLRRALQEEARTMNPSDDGLDRIRDRAASEPPSSSRRWAPWLAAAAVLAVVTAGIVWWPRGEQEATPGPAGSTVPSASASASTSPSSTASSSEPSQGAPITVPVYFVADVPGVGPRLYREFHQTPELDGSPVTTALYQLFGATAVDPDYSSAWPADTRVLSVSDDGTTATVNLSQFVSVGAEMETASVQQLVYTVTAADPTVKQVLLQVNGAAPASGHSDWSAPVTRAPMLDIQANVWILAPTEGATVSSPVKITVYGTGFEGNVPLKVFQGSTEVKATFVTTEMGGFKQASTTLQLPPGQYEVRAYNDSGQSASLRLWDTKTFTVR